MDQKSLNNLESEFQKIHSELDEDLPKGMIYHYTSFDGFKNIIKKRKLRHTDYRFFNDPTELQYGQNIILKALLDSNIDRCLIDRTKVFFDDFDKLYHLYIACFSRQIENLALWRYYAFNGTGFAIGFNENFYKVEATPAIMGKAVRYKVVYGYDESTVIINRFIEKYSSHNDDQIFPLLLTHLTSILPLFKDESFRDEDETRLVYMEGKNFIDPNTNQPFYFKDQYREFIPIQERNIPFVNNVQGKKPVVTPDKFCDSDISEIWVGAACEFLEARTCIKKLLKEAGYNVKSIDIRESCLPFRNT